MDGRDVNILGEEGGHLVGALTDIAAWEKQHKLNRRDWYPGCLVFRLSQQIAKSN